MKQPQIQDADRQFVVQLINPINGGRCPPMVVTQPQFEAAMRDLYKQYLSEEIDNVGEDAVYDAGTKVNDFLNHYVLILSTVEGNEAHMVDIPLFKVSAMLDILDLNEDAYQASLEQRLKPLEVPERADSVIGAAFPNEKGVNND